MEKREEKQNSLTEEALRGRRTASPELLAPAGEYPAMQGAIAAGADAVYLSGTRFGARAYARNFTQEELISALAFAHLRGRRIYLTLNTLIKESEFDSLAEFLTPLDDAGLDGIIVQDPGVMTFVRDSFPRIRLHASTQLAVTGPSGARYLKKLGVCRVVPARELSLKELAQIKNGTDEGDGGIEIEAFIHGAMCYSYSGMCLMSAMIGGRSGNRGRCAGACRLPYEPCGEIQTFLSDGSLAAATGKGRKTHSDGLVASKHPYPLSLRDMCTLPQLSEILRGGIITSLKIEGRMKEPVYAAGVTAVYRRLLDRIAEHPDEDITPDAEDMRILKGLYLRTDLCTGYYFLRGGEEMITGRTPGYAGKEEETADRISREYLEKPVRVPVECTLRARVGEPISLTLACADGVGVTVQGAQAQRAREQGMSEEVLRKNLDRFGESNFRPLHIRIEAEPDLFVPVSALNRLRREACKRLEEAILTEAQHVRSLQGDLCGKSDPLSVEAAFEAATLRELPLSGGVTDADGSEWLRGISVEHPGQLEAVADASEAQGMPDRIYLPLHAFRALKQTGCDEQRTLASAVRAAGDADGYSHTWVQALSYLRDKAGKKLPSLFAALPFMLRQDARDQGIPGMRLLFEDLPEGVSIAGVLARNLEELTWLREQGYAGFVEADQMLPLWNAQAMETLRPLFDGWTISPELGSREIAELIRHSGAGDSATMVVYGRVPMMVSAGCVQRTFGTCARKAAGDQVRGFLLSLRDRTGRQLPVSGDCAGCYNVIRNAVPLSLTGEEEILKRAGIRRVRYDLTTESAAQTREILGGESVAETTKGRFRKGVQ